MSINSQYILLIFSALLWWSCKTTVVDQGEVKRAMPTAFETDTNGMSAADRVWKEFFSDTNLKLLIDSALTGNLDLMAAMQRIEVSRAMARFNRDELLPKVSAGVSAGVNKYGLYTMDGAGNATTEFVSGKPIPDVLPDYFLAAQASWEVDIWGKLRNQKRAATAEFFGSIEAKNLIVSNLVADIAIAYYELLAYDRELEILQQTIRKQQETLEVLELQKEARRSNELAIEQFEALMLGTMALEREAMQKIIETENRIKYLSGRYNQPIIRTAQALQQPVAEILTAGVPSDLINNRPDIRKAEMDLMATKFEVKAARAAFFPNLNITGYFGFRAYQPDVLFLTPQSLAYGALGSLMAPIINMNSLRARFTTANARQLEALYNYRNVVLKAFLEVSNQVAALENLDAALDLKRRQTDVLAQSINTSTELYKSARANYLEVLVAQQNALLANLELVDVLKRNRMATVNLYKVLGGGWR